MSDPVEAFAAGLIAALQPAERRLLARDIAQLLRRANQTRIAAQQNPDGSAFEPRKPQRLRRRKGKLRRAMFAKLRTARFFKVQATSDAAIVGFTAEIERIARVHHHGLRDRVNRRGLEADYPARRLVGIAESDEAAIKDLIIDRLARRL